MRRRGLRRLQPDARTIAVEEFYAGLFETDLDGLDVRGPAGDRAGAGALQVLDRVDIELGTLRQIALIHADQRARGFELVSCRQQIWAQS